MTKMGNKLVVFLLTSLLMAILIAPGVVFAQIEDQYSVRAAEVYQQVDENSNPESIVVFSGNNNNNEGYIPGEIVHVEVRSPDGETLTCDATVDPSGTWSCSVNLWENSSVFGTFYYKATALQSGITYTSSFSNDGAIESIKLFTDDQEITENGIVNLGSIIDARILVNSENRNYLWGSTKYQIQQSLCHGDITCAWTPVFTSECINIPEPDLQEPLIDQEIAFSELFGQINTAGLYYVMFTTFSDGNCNSANGSQWYYSKKFDLQAAETITTLDCTLENSNGLDSLLCEAAVNRQSGSGLNPTGTVEFSIDPSDISSANPVTCTLVASSVGTSTCSTTIQMDQNEAFRLKADYLPDSDINNASSSDWVPSPNTSDQPVVTVIADAMKKTYGEVDPALTYSYSPSDTFIRFSGALSRSAGEDAGEYRINRGSLSAPGYTVQFSPATFTINKAKADIQIVAFSGVYDGIDHGLEGYATGVKGEDLSSLLSFGSSYKNAPGGPSSWIFRGNENYLADTNQMIPILIDPREIEVTADVMTKTYGEVDPVFSYELTKGSLAEGDEFLGEIIRDPGENAGMYVLDKGSLSAGNNYRISFIGAWFRINERPIKVAADPQSIEIGMPDPILSFKIVEGELVNGDMFIGSITRNPGDTPGVYPIGQGALYLSANYDLSFAGSTFAIFQSSIDLDDDYDGVSNATDNCVYRNNGDQQDSDADGFGDLCDTTPDTLMANIIVPVTGSSTTSSISCFGDTTLKLENGDFVTVPQELCSLTAILGQELQTSLPAEIPQGFNFNSALNLTLLDDQVLQALIDDPALITYSFQREGIIEDSPLSILFWDSALRGGVGDWIELPACSTLTPVSLHPDNDLEERTIFGCIERESNQRMEFSTNFTGLFVLATR